MPIPTDCINTRSVNGRNLTPLPILDAARIVLDGIALDPASDEVANRFVQAENFYSIEDDGLSQPWGNYRSIWLNPPGRTTSRGKIVSASSWFKVLYRTWIVFDFNAIGMVYRAGSIGSLGVNLLRYASICLTASEAKSPIISGSGRISFDIVEGDRRVTQTSNTQSSLIFLLSSNQVVKDRFESHYSQFGVIKH